MKFFSTALFMFLAAQLAQGATLDISRVVSLEPSARGVSLVMQGPVADQIYLLLKIQETPSWEDILEVQKNLNGIGCVGMVHQDPPEAVCSVSLDFERGVQPVLPSSGSSDLQLVWSGAAARQIYQALGGQDSVKTVPGLTCQVQNLTASYVCQISIDTGRGVLP